jgi:hypothetical protein
MEDESMVIMLVQQYAAKFGMTFSSKVMENEAAREKVVVMMAQAIAGQRGAITDEDLGI